MKKLINKGYKLGVATLKSQTIAENVLKIHKIYSYFDCVVGMDADESLTKKDTIRIGMNSTGSKNAVLVGDSQYDYDGAAAAGIDFIGVLYGFGLKDDDHDYPTIKKPLDLLAIV